MKNLPAILSAITASSFAASVIYLFALTTTADVSSLFLQITFTDLVAKTVPIATLVILIIIGTGLTLGGFAAPKKSSTWPFGLILDWGGKPPETQVGKTPEEEIVHEILLETLPALVLTMVGMGIGIWFAGWEILWVLSASVFITGVIFLGRWIGKRHGAPKKLRAAFELALLLSSVPAMGGWLSARGPFPCDVTVTTTEGSLLTPNQYLPIERGAALVWQSRYLIVPWEKVGRVSSVSSPFRNAKKSCPLPS